jgi:hypothetical protein
MEEGQPLLPNGRRVALGSSGAKRERSFVETYGAIKGQSLIPV